MGFQADGGSSRIKEGWKARWIEVENAEGVGAEGTQRLETIAAGDMEEREKDHGWDAMESHRCQWW